MIRADRAEFLQLASPVPAEVKVGEPLPDMEVRVMTTTAQLRDQQGNPTPIPLLHGEDTKQLIQLTVSWVRHGASSCPA